MSSREVGIEQARKILGDLANEVRYSGDDIILTRNGKPVARIAPLTKGPHDMQDSTNHRGVMDAKDNLRAAGHPVADIGDEHSTGYYVHALSSGDLVVISWLEDGKEVFDDARHKTAGRLFLGKMKWGSIPSPHTHMTLIPRWSDSMRMDQTIR